MTQGACFVLVSHSISFTAVSYWNNYFQALIYLINAEKYYPLALYILNRINTAPDILGDQKLYQQ